MGPIVWVINIVATTPPDYLGATTAALKQGGYTFLVAGFLQRIVTRLVLRPGRPWLVFTTAVLVSTTLASGSAFLVHSLRGTPSPLLSSMPTALLSLLGFPFMAAHARRKALRK